MDSSSSPKELDFAPSERPPWRTSTSLPETKDMLSQLLEWQTAAADWTPEQVEFVRTFGARKTVDFVLLSNQMEREGTQDHDSTEALVLAAMSAENSKSRSSSHSAVELATIQTYKALAWLFTKRTEMLLEAEGKTQEALFLTPSLISEAHKVLMADLIPNPGQFRQTEAYPSGSDFFYVSPHLIEAHIESLLDKYNSIVQHTELSGALVFKLAAWFLYHFLTIHPFSDGNGRLGRILANSILFLHVPFPVALKPRNTINSAFSEHMDDWREHYINAIVECRQDNKVPGSAHRPRDLAALFIQSVWHEWKSVTEALEFRSITSRGPLVMTNSHIKLDELALKVRRWNKECDTRLAASEILQQLNSRREDGEFSIVLSDGKKLMILDRTHVDTNQAHSHASSYRDLAENEFILKSHFSGPFDPKN